MKQKTADSYNKALRKLGDENPDFLAAVSNLTASACSRFNETVLDVREFYVKLVNQLKRAGY